MNKLAKVQPWERLEGEVGGAWIHFQQYRDAGPGRSIQKIAEMTGTPLSTLKSQSASYDWRDRATAFDRHLDSIRVAAVESDEQARAKASRDAVTLLGQATIHELVKAVNEAKSQPFSTFKVSELIKATEAIVALQRLIDGEATSRVEVATVSYENLSDEDLATLEAISNKLGGGQ